MLNITSYFTPQATPQSFLNPVNLQIMFDSYNSGNYAAILKRFNLEDEETIHALMGYFRRIVDEVVVLKDFKG